MAWITLSVSDLQDRLAGAEVTALQSAALASGQADPVPGIITQAIDEARGYIGAGGFTLGAGTTIPQKLKSAVLAVVRYRVATRLPGRAVLNEDRVREYQDAISLLEQVARGLFAVEEPATEDTEETDGGDAEIEERELTYTRDDQDGL